MIHPEARHAFAISPHNSNPLTRVTRAIYVGGAGDITLITEKGDEVLFKAVPVGTILPVRASIVKATGTGATFLLGLY